MHGKFAADLEEAGWLLLVDKLDELLEGGSTAPRARALNIPAWRWAACATPPSPSTFQLCGHTVVDSLFVAVIFISLWRPRDHPSWRAIILRVTSAPRSPPKQSTMAAAEYPSDIIDTRDNVGIIDTRDTTDFLQPVPFRRVINLPPHKPRSFTMAATAAERHNDLRVLFRHP